MDLTDADDGQLHNDIKRMLDGYVVTPDLDTEKGKVDYVRNIVIQAMVINHKHSPINEAYEHMTIALTPRTSQWRCVKPMIQIWKVNLSSRKETQCRVHKHDIPGRLDRISAPSSTLTIPKLSLGNVLSKCNKKHLTSKKIEDALPCIHHCVSTYAKTEGWPIKPDCPECVDFLKIILMAKELTRQITLCLRPTVTLTCQTLRKDAHGVSASWLTELDMTFA